MTDKFKTLVHYVCDKRSDRADTLGKVKLNKIAWLSDRIMYLRRGEAITPQTYIKRQFGPVAQSMLETLESLQSDGSLVIRGVDYFGYEKYEYVTLRRPNVSEFTGEEISLIDDVIDVVCDEHTATSISAASHDAIWKCAALGEILPHYTVFASVEGEITEDDLAWATREAERLRL